MKRIKKKIQAWALEAFIDVQKKVAVNKKLDQAEHNIGKTKYKFDFAEIRTTKDIVEVLRILDSKITIVMDKEEFESVTDNKKYLKKL